VLPVSARVLVAEGLGTALLLAVVVGSGIMGEALADGNVAVALLANSIATALGLFVLVLVFGPISGAHFNPVVSVVDAVRRRASMEAAPRIAAQLVGAPLGVVLAHAMFDQALVQASLHEREGVGLWIGEIVATAGLIGVVLAVPRHRPDWAPLAVGAWVGSAYWFTSSTSFANPAVTLARTLTDTFTGIRPIDAPAFVAAQVVGAALGATVFGWLLAGPAKEPTKEKVAT
jgi:glycerol uptake facilitator-like aquaporin